MLALSPETEALVRARAAEVGKTPDEVIRDALHGDGRGPARSHASRKQKATLAEILAIAEASASRPLLDPRAPDAIIGYDEDGLPK